MHVFKILLNILFPVACVRCGADGSYMCIPCGKLLPRVRVQPGRDIAAVLDYRDPYVRSLIQMFKYRGGKGVAPHLVQCVEKELRILLPWKDHEKAVIIPIPPSPRNLKVRGFDQTSVLLEEFLKAAQIPMTIVRNNVLIRQKGAARQAQVRTRAERMRNAEGMFALYDTRAISGKHVIVFDDVVTTGATMREAMRILLRAGALNVRGVAIAHKPLK